MSLFYPWVLFFAVPLFILYKNEPFLDKHQTRQKKLLYLSLFFIILSLSRPVISNTLSEQKFDSQDFIIAVDISFSMQADDLQPNRYEIAKQKIKEILQKLPKDRFSIFAFTSNAMLISPPTTDTAISLMALDSLKSEYILTKGTSLIQLLKTISKTSYEKKNLIIFSDGGEEYNLDALVNICKQNNITPYIVATGSKEGTVLKKYGKYLKNNKQDLVISKINPILKDFANKAGGKYYELDSNSKNIVDNLISDISKTKNNSDATSVKVMDYKEFFWLPLAIAIVLFFISVTKIHQLYIILPIIFLPDLSYSSLIDFYHLKDANKLYKQQNYEQSAYTFKKLSPSVESYYNQAVAFYKAKEYRNAIEIFSKIKTTSPIIKQKIYYNLGNCAVQLAKYERAKIYYQKALALGYDKDAFYNLSLIYKLKQKRDLSNLLPKQKSHKKTQVNKKENTKKDKENKNASKSKRSGSNQKASESSAGSTNTDKKKKQNDKLQKTDKTTKSNYKLGYKAYELINKGYTDETHPW